MHECGKCGYVCDCDGEDTWNDQEDGCVHFTPGNCPDDDEPIHADDVLSIPGDRD